MRDGKAENLKGKNIESRRRTAWKRKIYKKWNPRAGDAIGRGGDRVSCRTAGCSISFGKNGIKWTKSRGGGYFIKR